MQSLVLSKEHPVALELVGTEAYRGFVIRATSPLALNHIKAQLQTLYPQLEIRPLPLSQDPFRMDEHEEIHVIELKTGAAPYLPMRTWQESGRQHQGTVDPVMGLLASLSNLEDGTRLVAQLSLLPAEPDWSKKYLHKATERPSAKSDREFRAELYADRRGDIYTGNVLIGVIAAVLLIMIAIQRFIPPELFSTLLEPDAWPWLIGSGLAILGGAALLVFGVGLLWRKIFPKPSYDIELIRQKTSRMAYHVRLRLYAICPFPPQASNSSFWQHWLEAHRRKQQLLEHLLPLVAAYRQYDLAGGAYFTPRHLLPVHARKLVARAGFYHGWQHGVRHSPHLLSVDSVAALWHLPASDRLADIAMVQHAQSHSLKIPPDLAKLFAEYPPVGYSDHGGYHLPFALIPQFFKSHTLIAGKSGEGKRTCIEHIARQTMKNHGMVLIDPHGDLYEHLLTQVPANRIEDVIVIDLAEQETVLGLNPLDVTLGRSRDKAVTDLIRTFSHIWPDAWGPRMENAFEMALRTLFAANEVLLQRHGREGAAMQYTLLDVMPILTDEEFCSGLLQRIPDDYLHRWWREFFDPLTLVQQHNIVNPVLTKVTKFESLLARRIVGQGVSTLNLNQIVAEKKILFVNLAESVVGSDMAALVGATILNLLQVALEQSNYARQEAHWQLPIILDELQTLAGVDYAALAGLRKYGATFLLAIQSLQYLEKIDPVLLPTILANVKQMITFHMSAGDAEIVAPELGLRVEDVLSLDPHMSYIKMPTDDHRHPVFSVKWENLVTGDLVLAESMRARSRVRYTTDASHIDKMLHIKMSHPLRLLTGNLGREEEIPYVTGENYSPPPEQQQIIALPAHKNNQNIKRSVVADTPKSSRSRRKQV